MQNPEFTPDEDFNEAIVEFEQWLAQDRQPTQHINMSDDDLRLLSTDELIALIRAKDQHISKLMDDIEWHEEESGHE
jgi:hypothetical protein